MSILEWLQSIGIVLGTPLLWRSIFIVLLVAASGFGYMVFHNIVHITSKGNARMTLFRRPILRVARILLVVLVVLLSLQIAGIDIAFVWTAVSAVLALFAVAFFALWSILVNVTCAVLLGLNRTFTLGTDIEILEPSSTSGLRGVVVDVGAFYTTIRDCSSDSKTCDSDNSDSGGETIETLVRIPNSIFFQKNVRVRRPVVDKDHFSISSLSGDPIEAIKKKLHKHGLLSSDNLEQNNDPDFVTIAATSELESTSTVTPTA